MATPNPNEETESTEQPDAAEMRADLDRIKTAMELHDRYPFWSRWWLIEGVGVGLLFPLIQLFSRGNISLVWLVLLGGGVFVAHQLALRRIIGRYDQPASGVPSWMNWQYIAVAGVLTLVVGLRPVGDDISASGELSFAAIAGGTMVGVAYLFMGQLLESYRIRKADRYAFYASGVWMLLLAAVLPNVPSLQGWVFTALGVGTAVQHVGAYLYISHA